MRLTVGTGPISVTMMINMVTNVTIRAVMTIGLLNIGEFEWPNRTGLLNNGVRNSQS
jgi:hypothetical protein